VWFALLICDFNVFPGEIWNTTATDVVMTLDDHFLQLDAVPVQHQLCRARGLP